MILRLATGLDNDLFQPRIVTQLSGELAARARDYGIPVAVVPYRGILDTYERGLASKSPIQNLKVGMRLVQYNYEVRRILNDIDVIWCGNIRMLLSLAPTAALADSTVIWNIGLGIESTGVYKWLNGLGFRLADHVFIESETQARRLYGDQFEEHKHKFTVFHKGIDTEMYAPETPLSLIHI